MSHRMGNPVAVDEISKLLRKGIKAGVYVKITDPSGIGAYRLKLDQNEQFQMVPRL